MLGHSWQSQPMLASGTQSPPTADASPFLSLPRELRDQIYNYVYAIPERRPEPILRIERRNIKHFQPTAATILLLLHHDYLLLNRQIAGEALEILLKNHTVRFSCGPYVLKTLLTKVEHAQHRQGKQWLRWMKRIELEWSTFPNLRMYPPNRENGKDQWWWEHDTHEVDVDYIRGAQYSGFYDEHDYGGHYDEYDHEGEAYNDNLYAAEDPNLYPSFTAQQSGPTADPFGFSTHYPFSDPTRDPMNELSQDDIATKLKLLVDMEVEPLFNYLQGPKFALSSMTLPLYFVARNMYRSRSISRPAFALPLKLRYWVQVAACALSMLLHPSADSGQTSRLKEVRVKYMPWDIPASLEPTDDLTEMAEEGIQFHNLGDPGSEGKGATLRAVWQALAARGVDASKSDIVTQVELFRWEGDLETGRVGDELEIVFTRKVPD